MAELASVVDIPPMCGLGPDTFIGLPVTLEGNRVGTIVAAEWSAPDAITITVNAPDLAADVQGLSLGPVSIATDDCATCGETPNAVEKCPKAQRPCGHHCNHVWESDTCCWCGKTFGEEPPTTPAEPALAVALPSTPARERCPSCGAYIDMLTLNCRCFD